MRFTILDDAGSWLAEGERDDKVWTLRYERGEERFAGSEKAARKKALARLEQRTEEEDPTP